jgi:hypothetical protein
MIEELNLDRLIPEFQDIGIEKRYSSQTPPMRLTSWVAKSTITHSWLWEMDVETQ